MKKLTFIAFVTATLIAAPCYAQNIGNYLILNDIGTFRISKPQAVFKKRPPIGGPSITQNDSGVLSGAGHFPDHSDTTYQVRYIGENDNPAPKVQVTQHTGSDSDRWLLHEIECAYRTSKVERLGLVSQGTRLREINGNKIIGMRGSGYTWLSNNIIVDISYTDLDGTKAEPLEIVQAYLAKFPSIITITDTVFKSSEYNIKWIKDEMDRHFWLCDKWNAQFQAGKTTQKDLLYNLVNNMEVFLNYRQKYFGDINARDELTALYELQQNKDIASIQTKLSEYKGWWSTNKARSISLP